eukprot:6204490-Pyramimonas_sp.AAC.1
MASSACPALVDSRAALGTPIAAAATKGPGIKRRADEAMARRGPQRKQRKDTSTDKTVFYNGSLSALPCNDHVWGDLAEAD